LIGVRSEYWARDEPLNEKKSSWKQGGRVCQAGTRRGLTTSVSAVAL
jgi:hypothetical protein